MSNVSSKTLSNVDRAVVDVYQSDEWSAYSTEAITKNAERAQRFMQLVNTKLPGDSKFHSAESCSDHLTKMRKLGLIPKKFRSFNGRNKKAR